MKTRKLNNIKSIVKKVTQRWLNMLNSDEDENRERMRQIVNKYKS